MNGTGFQRDTLRTDGNFLEFLAHGQVIRSVGGDVEAIRLLSCLGCFSHGEVAGGRGQDNFPSLSIGIPEVTAPGILGQVLDHAGLEGVAFNVPSSFQKVTFGLDREAVVTALPEMAGETVLSAHMEPVTPLNLMHETDQFFRSGSAKEQVDMVGHEAVVVEVNIVRRDGCRAESEVESEVVLFAEDALSIVSARGDMVEAGFAPCSWLSSHVW